MATGVASSDLVFLEPAIEALYYKHAPCEISIAAAIEYADIFKNHPLIKTVSGIHGNGEITISSGTRALYLLSIEETELQLPPVLNFAAQLDVSLLRTTPALFASPEADDDRSVLVCFPNEKHVGVDWLHDMNDLLQISHSIHISERDAAFQLMNRFASCRLVIGPDSWMMHAAAAVNARTLVGMTDPGIRQRRQPGMAATRSSLEEMQNYASRILQEKKYPDYMNRGNAADWIKAKAKEYVTPGWFDIGCSRWPMEGATPVDVQLDNRHLIDAAPENSVSGIFSSHCLEHITDWEAELALWHRALRPGGYLFLYLPHPACEPWRAWTGSWVGPHHVWNPEPVTLVRHLIENLKFDVVEYTSQPDQLWSFYIVARKRYE